MAPTGKGPGHLTTHRAARSVDHGNSVLEQHAIPSFLVRSAAEGPVFRVIACPTARGCAAAYFPETNVLVPLDHTAEVSNTPAAKSIIVRLDAGS